MDRPVIKGVVLAVNNRMFAFLDTSTPLDNNRCETIRGRAKSTRGRFGTVTVNITEDARFPGVQGFAVICTRVLRINEFEQMLRWLFNGCKLDTNRVQGVVEVDDNLYYGYITHKTLGAS